MDAELEVAAVGGVRMIADVSTSLGKGLATTGLWEWNVGAAIQQILRPGDVFVDVGANVGYYTLLAARIVGFGGHVYALEPAPETYRELRRNLELSGLARNVAALEVAAGAGEGRATLYGPAGGHDPTSSLRRRRGQGGPATEVSVQPLHAIVDPAHRGRLSLVKIDVEGHEDEALRGFEPLLAEVRPAILVEIHASYNPDAPAFVSAFCARHALQAHWLVDPTTDERFAPADRTLVLGDLGASPRLDLMTRDRYALLLEPRP